jgi:hypothetical protein
MHRLVIVLQAIDVALAGKTLPTPDQEHLLKRWNTGCRDVLRLIWDLSTHRKEGTPCNTC